ncbi:MAG: flippase-like domain-containing protein [Candidatus Moraniibacteriota bacterium]|nr:MAG: flippase-like domain-containing protein [Candidatus Moranbacteria bacterium]
MLLETKKSEKRKPLSFAFKLLVSVGFVSWLLFRLDWTDVMKRILEVDGNYLLLYLALLLFGMFLSAKKWRLPAQHKGFARPQGDFFQAYLTGAFINNFSLPPLGAIRIVLCGSVAETENFRLRFRRCLSTDSQGCGLPWCSLSFFRSFIGSLCSRILFGYF